MMSARSSAALQRASKVLAQHRLEVEIDGTLPMLKLDAVLFEQVLFNILDNAAKYAPANSTIRLTAWQARGRWRCRSWMRATASRRRMSNGSSINSTGYGRAIGRAGTGLGLPICRGFIEAMGGTVEAANRSDRSGAVITIKLPVPTDAPQLDELHRAGRGQDPRSR